MKRAEHTAETSEPSTAYGIVVQRLRDMGYTDITSTPSEACSDHVTFNAKNKNGKHVSDVVFLEDPDLRKTFENAQDEEPSISEATLSSSGK